MKKNRLYILSFVFIMFFCVSIDGIKAEKFDIVFTCNNSNATCPLSIVDGELAANSNFCDISGNWGGGVENRKIHIKKINVSGDSKCYKADYKCVWDTKTHYFEIDNLKFVKTDATKNDASKGIICPNKPLIDMCRDYTEDNFREKCPNAPEDATYKDFRGRCDLSYQNAMDYCQGKGSYYEGGTKNRNMIDKIKNAVGIKDETFTIKNGELTCTELLGTDNVKLISSLFLYICVAGVVLVIILGSTDFVRAVASSDEDALAQAFKKIKTRLISVVILLLLPILVNMILSFVNGNAHFEVVGEDEKEKDVSIKIGSVTDCGLIADE